jgi:hypothetical protein
MGGHNSVTTCNTRVLRVNDTRQSGVYISKLQ